MITMEQLISQQPVSHGAPAMLVASSRSELSKRWQSEGLEGVRQADVDRLIASLEPLVRPMLPSYRQMVSQYDPALEKKGRDIVRGAAGKAWQTIFGEEKDEGKPGPAPAPDLLRELSDPLLGPFMRGAKLELKRVVLPVVTGGVAVLLLLGTGVFLLGRWSRSKWS